MKILKKILVVLIVTLFCYLPNRQFSEVENYFQLNNYTSSNEQNQIPSFFIISSNSPFQVTLPENNLFTTNIVYQQVFKTFAFNNFGISQKNKNAIFYTTVEYVSICKYVCNKLKKADLIYPFHFFL